MEDKEIKRILKIIDRRIECAKTGAYFCGEILRKNGAVPDLSNEKFRADFIEKERQNAILGALEGLRREVLEDE